MLNFKETTVPEGLDEHYEASEDGTSFTLKVEGLPEAPKDRTAEVDTLTLKLSEETAKVDEFRANNIKLKTQIEKDSTSDSKIESLVQDALQPFRDKNIELEKTNKMLNSNLEEVVLSDKIKSLAIESGVYDSAIADVVVRAKTAFSVKEGKVVPSESNARDSEGNLFTTESWMKNLTDTAQHLFKPSQGSSAFRSKDVRTQQKQSSVSRIAAGLKKK